MGDKTGIEWTDATWNPVLGCEKVSAGCDHCYAIPMSARVEAMGVGAYADLTVATPTGREWTGLVRELPERLDQPIRWARPRRIFVNSMSDLFHGDVSRDFQARVFAVMAVTPRHTYQVLTKRPGVMRSRLRDPEFIRLVNVYAEVYAADLKLPGRVWTMPLPNVWLGTSVEDQAAADLRIRPLLETPAAVRFLSMEPLLGPVDLFATLEQYGAGLPPLDWCIVGGESGPGSRAMDAQWVRWLRDDCQGLGVAFHFKQWGSHDEHGTPMAKKAAGRVLDGRTWDEWPTGG
jgi:protein gp37